MSLYLNLKQFEDDYLSDNDTLCSLTSISSISSNYSSNFSSLNSLAELLSEKSIDDHVENLILKYKIERNLANHLYLLKDYKIIIVCDDSGSMNTIIDQTNRTRWDQLCYIVKIILEIGTIFDSNGVDIHFINRGSFFNLINPKLIDAIFSIRPCGYTPLVPVLRNIFKSSFNSQKKTLVFIATDGAPTDNKGNVNIKDLEHLMINGRQSESTHVMFLACTDDQSSVDYLNEWDKNMINVDVTDNYEREKNKILSFRGPNYSFSIGDYIVKALIGAIHPQTDQINEP